MITVCNVEDEVYFSSLWLYSMDYCMVYATGAASPDVQLYWYRSFRNILRETRMEEIHNDYRN